MCSQKGPIFKRLTSLRQHADVALYILEHVRWCDVESVTQLKHQAHARAVAAKLNQGHIVAVNVNPQSQVGLRPLFYARG